MDLGIAERKDLPQTCISEAGGYVTKRCHCHYACITICDRDQKCLDRKNLSLHSFGILGFSAKVSLDLEQFCHKLQRDIVA